jgi:hypothetical protein
MRHAIVESGIVTNIIEWDGAEHWQPPAGAAIIALHETACDIGWTYDGQAFTSGTPDAGGGD